jgi:hypothetical protein
MKIIKILFFTLLFTFFAKEFSNFIFQSNIESRVYNTGFYYLSQKPLTTEHNFDSLFTPYHIYLLNYRPSPENFVRYFDNVRYLSYALVFFSFSALSGLVPAFILSTIVVVSPLTLISKTWISFPDSYTFLFAILFILLKIKENSIVENLNNNTKDIICKSILSLSYFKRNYSFLITYIFIIFLGLFNHFYQFVIIAFEIILISFIFCKNKKRVIFDLILLLFLCLLARGVSHFLFFYNNLEIVDYRINVVKSISFDEFIKINFNNFFKGLYSFLFGLWGIFLFDLIIKKNYSQIILFCISFCITCFTYDTTRVFTLLFFIPFLFSLYLNLKNYTKLDIKILSFLTFLSILLYSFSPLYYKWGERIIYLK